MKTLILTAALVVSTATIFAQKADDRPADLPGEKNTIEVAVFQTSENTLNLHLEKNPGETALVKVYEENNLLYKRRIKKASTANITYDISSFPDGIYTVKVEKDKNVVYKKVIRKGSTSMAGNF